MGPAIATATALTIDHLFRGENSVVSNIGHGFSSLGKKDLDFGAGVIGRIWDAGSTVVSSLLILSQLSLIIQKHIVRRLCH